MRRGRFAPSPTGPLHFGSLVTALASYLDARSQGSHWLVRMEDLDTPRCVPGAAGAILRTLEAHALVWDGDVLYQSRRTAAYREALEQLQRSDLAYPCGCTRKEVEETGASRYPGTCRAGLRQGRFARAWRLRTTDQLTLFTDHIQGPQQENVERIAGDFILLRADGIFAYQLAVVVDDAWQGITDIVRGSDLLDSTARQMLLQDYLHYQRPTYAHLPVALNEHGQKLSKQNLAPAINDRDASNNLRRALRFLGQADPPPELQHAAEILRFATDHWNLDNVPRVLTLRTDLLS